MRNIIFTFLFILFLSPFIPLNAHIENPVFSDNNDSLYRAAVNDSSETVLNILNSSNTKFYYFKNSDYLVFRSKDAVQKFIDSSGSNTPFGFETFDFDNKTLVLISYHGGDCHATFRYGYKRADNEKKIQLKVYVFYGGCRAGGTYMTDWAVIPKLPDDYTAELITVMMENKF